MTAPTPEEVKAANAIAAAEQALYEAYNALPIQHPLDDLIDGLQNSVAAVIDLLVPRVE